MGKITIDPVTRVEGHLKIEGILEDGEVKEARSSGTLLRGLELILKGRDPRDAQQLTQRICGVCPTSHSMAAALNLDNAFGIADKIPNNGKITRNLILGAAHIADHILHFYHLAALDYVDITKMAEYEGDIPALNSIKSFIKRGELGPFAPRYEGDYRLSDKATWPMIAHYAEAFDMRRKSQEMLSIFGGKMPHNVGIVPGGVTSIPTMDKMTSFLWRLKELQEFIDNVYIPDVLEVARGYPDYFEIGRGPGNLLAYGAYELEGSKLFKPGITSTALDFDELKPDKIAEEVKHSWYSDSIGGRHPSQGEVMLSERKEGAYSWIKSPRYEGKVYETGPLARLMVGYAAGQQEFKSLVDPILARLGVSTKAMFSVLGRHLARALETKLIADSMASWVLELKPNEPVYTSYELPQEATGMGLTEAARGALGHWIEVKEGKVENYQVITPTTWNASPMDDEGQPGPMEQAIMGTKVKDESNPFEIMRIVRSFDPCLACAVHLVNPKRKTLGNYCIC